MSWETGVLGEICDVRDGTHDSPKYQNEGIPLVTSKNLINGSIDFTSANLITGEDHTKISKRSKVDNGDILYAMIGTVGNPSIVNTDTVFSIKNVGLIKFKEGSQIYNRYLIFALDSDFVKRQILRESKGGTQKFVSLKVLRNLKIPLPPLPVQKKIAAVLEKADALRGQCQQMEQELNTLAQSVFLDMFGDPVKNPKKWDIEKFENYIEYIGDIGSNGSNATISANLEMLDEENYALMVRTTNFNKKDFTDNVKYVSKKTYDFFKKSQIFGGEIIMNKIGSAGQFWIMPELNKPVSLGLNQFVIRLKNLNTDYLFYYLSTEFGQKVIQSKLNGATTKSITKGAVKELPLMLPPIELQNKFSEFIQKNKALAPNKLQIELENNFNSLMQRAFKGELELKDVV